MFLTHKCAERCASSYRILNVREQVSKMSVCLADITGATACAKNLLNNTDRDNLEMASLALNKFLILKHVLQT